MREPDQEVPVGEDLYRSIHKDWVEGTRLLPFGIDSKGSSCNRSKFSPPETSVRPEKLLTGVAAISGAELPPPAEHNSVTWEFFVVDAPLEANDAHCEIRTRRASDRPNTKNREPGSPAAKIALKAELANRFRVVIEPI